MLFNKLVLLIIFIYYFYKFFLYIVFIYYLYSLYKKSGIIKVLLYDNYYVNIIL